MNKRYIITVIGLISIVFIVAGIIYSENILSHNRTGQISKEDLPSQPCTPAFVDGGGPYYVPNSPFRESLSPPEHNGETLIVKGHIVQADCKTPVASAILDIWHANEQGTYVDDWYRGQIKTDEQGSFTFQTVIPKGYGEGTGYRPPHIHYKVFVGTREIITSQLFFPEISGTKGFDDAFIMDITTEHNGQSRIHYATHTIVLPQH
jgi:protocatechuate 3,4-dioxygenase beta subunit